MFRYNVGKGKYEEGNSYLPFLLNLDFCASRFVLAEPEIIYASYMFPGENDIKKRVP